MKPLVAGSPPPPPPPPPPAAAAAHSQHLICNSKNVFVPAAILSNYVPVLLLVYAFSGAVTPVCQLLALLAKSLHIAPPAAAINETLTRYAGAGADAVGGDGCADCGGRADGANFDDSSRISLRLADEFTFGDVFRDNYQSAFQHSVEESNLKIRQGPSLGLGTPTAASVGLTIVIEQDPPAAVQESPHREDGRTDYGRRVNTRGVTTEPQGVATGVATGPQEVATGVAIRPQGVAKGVATGLCLNGRNALDASQVNSAQQQQGYLRETTALVGCMLDLAVLLTFGLACPLLALAVTIKQVIRHSVYSLYQFG